MPNWCSNCLKVAGSKEYIDGMAAAFLEGRLLNYIAPVEYNDATWYDDNIAAWGVKWDVGSDDDYHTVEPSVNDGEWVFTGTFNSAWAPPTVAYQALVDQGIEMEAYYHEPGMNFCGKFTADGDDCYQIEGDSEWVRDNIPEDIDMTLGISELMESWED